jgi:hypothetical protein
MKTVINKHQKIKSICRVINNYPQAFDTKTLAKAMKDDFNQQSDYLSDLISKLIRPASTIHRPKQDQQQKLSLSLQEYIGMGILLATHLENMPLLDILKVYKTMITNVSAYRLYEIGVHVAEELLKNSELAVEYGITTEMMTSFKAQVSEFGETLDHTGFLLTGRKADWSELNKQLVACSKTIRLKLDPFIEFNEKEFPDLFKEYMLVRGSRKRRKKAVPSDPGTGDFSGVVTNSVTGIPVANATINILERELAITTDADGYYLIDELDAGTYTLSCHGVGYEVPPQQSNKMEAGESLVVDFTLVPVNPLNN